MAQMMGCVKCMQTCVGDVFVFGFLTQKQDECMHMNSVHAYYTVYIADVVLIHAQALKDTDSFYCTKQPMFVTHYLPQSSTKLIRLLLMKILTGTPKQTLQSVHTLWICFFPSP